MGMVHGVHRHTASRGPRVALDAELVVRTTSLHDGLVGTATTGNDTDHSAAVRRERLLGARGEANAGAVSISVVREDGGIVARSAGKSTAVADLLLNVADNGTLGESLERDNVTDGEAG